MRRVRARFVLHLKVARFAASSRDVICCGREETQGLLRFEASIGASSLSPPGKSPSYPLAPEASCANISCISQLQSQTPEVKTKANTQRRLVKTKNKTNIKGKDKPERRSQPHIALPHSGGFDKRARAMLPSRLHPLILCPHQKVHGKF